MKILTSILVLALFFVLIYQVKAQQSPKDEVVIIDNSGSTNFSGYRMVIDNTGRVEIMRHGKASINLVYSNGFYNVSPELVRNLINDLKAILPFSELTPRQCAKSVSFGTSTFVTYKGQTSPDIQCRQDEKFVKDVFQITGAIPKFKLK